MSTIPDAAPGTRPGSGRSAPVPSPSSPKRFEPQQRTPPFTSAQVLESVAAICATPLSSPETPTAMFRRIAETLPSWPTRLAPQHHAAPRESTAHECAAPSASIGTAAAGHAAAASVQSKNARRVRGEDIPFLPGSFCLDNPGPRYGIFGTPAEAIEDPLHALEMTPLPVHPLASGAALERRVEVAHLRRQAIEHGLLRRILQGDVALAAA